MFWSYVNDNIEHLALSHLLTACIESERDSRSKSPSKSNEVPYVKRKSIRAQSSSFWAFAFGMSKLYKTSDRSDPHP